MTGSESFLERLADPAILRRAWLDVQANRGVPGVDRVSVGEFARDADAGLAALAEEIRSGHYRPLPALRIRPPFLAESDRAIVVPAVRDRVVQRAIANLLEPGIEPILSPICCAFRKGRSANEAARQAGEWIAAGAAWVLRTDVEKFFDTIQPEILERQLEPFVDARGIGFLRRIFRARIFDQDQVIEPVTGISQGSPLSPILSNLYLNEVDHALRAEHPRCLRYCDDFLLVERDESAVRAGLSLLAEKLQALGLKLNERKTRVCRAEDGFVFLGFHFGAAGKGPATKAVDALRYRLATIASSDFLDLEELGALFRGWTAYYGSEPEPWFETSAGILALLRQRDASAWDSISQRLTSARWRIAEEPPPQLALALAEAWTEAGLEGNAWIEFGRRHLGAKVVDQPDRWARALGTSPPDLTRLLARLRGEPAEVVAVLAEAAAEAGRFEAARGVQSSGAAAVVGAGPASPPSDPAEEADLPLLLECFQGRDGVHATESIGRGGHRRFVPDHRPIREEDWLAHLRGERTLALPLIRADRTTLLGVLDVDVGRRELDLRLGIPDDLLGRALGTALRLRAELARAGAGSLLEFSGYKGYHVWVRFREPVLAAQARVFLHRVLGGAGPVPEGVRVEVFPTRDRVRGGEVGPVIKLPLGIHGRSGRRCDLLDDRGRALADPMEALRSLARMPASQVASPEPGTAPRPATAPPSPLGLRATKVVDGCGVLRLLAEKAQRTSYLSHVERTALLCTLGHLGEEGAAALHAIISRTHNFRREVTQRHIDRMPSHPISCGRIREVLPEVSATARCACQFHLRGRGYPTPLLFAMRPSEVPVFRREARPAKAVESGASAPPRRHDPRTAELEQAVARVAELRRQLRHVGSALDRALATLEAAFDRAGGDSIELPAGMLRRVRRADGSGWDYRVEV